MNVSVFDFGSGNLHSIAKALSLCGDVNVRIEDDPLTLVNKSDVIVFPGVGAFGFAAKSLEPIRIEINELTQKGFPIIGVCLGMQVLFDKSAEGQGRGLRIIDGNVTKLRAARVPHMGWNKLETNGPSLSKFNGSEMYFANSYVCRAEDPKDVVATTAHETDQFASIVRKNNVVGMQFHPEKSSTPGLALLKSVFESVTK